MHCHSLKFKTFKGDSTRSPLKAFNHDRQVIILLNFTKRFLSAILVTVLLFSLSACGARKSDNEAENAAFAAARYLDKLGKLGYSDKWRALAYGSWDVSDSKTWRKDYTNAVQQRIDEKGGILDNRKYSEYAASIFGLAAAGEDPRSFCGLDLCAVFEDTETTLLQGISGAVWALIAVDYAGTGISTADIYLDYIFEHRLDDGGFAFSGEKSDPDITAMVLIALSKYSDYGIAGEMIDSSLDYLSQAQLDDGGYSSFGVTNCESCAQVLLAMCSLGISLDDERFVKNGNTVYNAIMSYENKDGSFSHTPGGEADATATVQALMALISYLRVTSGYTDIFTQGD